MASPDKSVKDNNYTELKSVSSNNEQNAHSNKTASEVISIKKEADVISKKNEGGEVVANKSEVSEKGKADIVEDKTEEKIEAKDLPENRRHKIADGCSLFPVHTWLYFIYIFLSIVLAVFGTLLLICGSWANTGYFSFHAILNYPWPKVEVENQDFHAMALEFLQLSCWICGFFFWLLAIYLAYVVYIYHFLLWSVKPWDRKDWNGVRVAADQVLGKSKVRDETMDEQFNRMNQKQQEEMKKYKMILMEPTKYSEVW